MQRVLGKHSDLALVLLVLGVLVVLFAPIPPGLLDFLILANFSFALLILLLTFYMARPVEFSTFPSLLLIATLFRLSLNVAATRLILSDADAGQVIRAIGSYVVGGNYVIGLIVFLILVVVQYVVVTNGAQRVSEVAARFTLDSMPGQQMSIDADLNMGFIDQAEAQRRRKNIEKEAGFLRRDGRRQQVRQGRCHRRHHHPADQHHRRPGHRRDAAPACRGARRCRPTRC